MAKKLYEESNISAIANAIRLKNGSQDTYTTSEMADAIEDIETSGILITKSIIENGTYNALLDDNADGYSQVVVNVSSGGGNINIISREYYNSLSTDGKKLLGNVIIQDNNSGYYLGEYVNASFYHLPAEIVNFSAKNSGPQYGTLSYEFEEDIDCTVVIAFVQTGNISQANIKLNNVSINDSFSELYDGSFAHLYIATIHALDGDIITITTNAGSSTSTGTQLLILKNISSVVCVGATANNASGIIYTPLSAEFERYLNVIKYGYSNGMNTIPSLDLFYANQGGTTPAIDASSPYWYGGQYLLKLQ